MGGSSDSALVSLIKQRREMLLRSGTGNNEQVIFLDNRLTPTPECILRDPVLNPYDKILWQGILAVAQSEGGPPGTLGAGTTMPTYEALGNLVHVSRMSISTSIAALRATRWLIVNKIRDENGSVKGQLYIIAYAPWDLNQALDIDEHYISWLEEQTEERRDQRIQRIAQAVWDTITEDRRNGIDITAPIDPVQKVMEASRALQGQSGRFYSIGSNALKTLTRRQAESANAVVVPIDGRDDGSGRPEDYENSAENRLVRNSYSGQSAEIPEDLQRANPDRITTSPTSSSNHYINNKKNTTTTVEQGLPEELSTLAFPSSLKLMDKQRIGKVLVGLLPDQLDAQQMLLDELGGRIEWGKPFRGNTAAWFKGMAQNYLRMGEDFIPNYADKYSVLRQKRAAEQAEHEERTRPRTPEEEAAAKKAADRALAQIRETFPSMRNRNEERG